MAATVRSELYDGLVRKIGYSVGLEYLVLRVSELVELYLSQGTVTGGDWHQLVKSWGRNSTAEQHIADFYSSLDLIRRYNSAIHVLPGLEVLGILFGHERPTTMKADGDAHVVALKFVLAQKLLEADGDIFLNALLVNFDPSDLLEKLQDLIRFKRGVVRPHFKQASVIRRVMESIAIKNQTEADGKPKRMSYAEQSRLMWSNGGPSKHKEWTEQEIFISDDYVEKVCVTRRGWAEDLGLFNKSLGGLTETGSALLNGARKVGLSFDTEHGHGFAFWPYGFELRKMSLPPKDLGVADISPWDVINVVSGIFVPRETSIQGAEQEAPTRVAVISMLAETLALYRNVDKRGTIRHDLPLFIAEPVLAFWLRRGGQQLPDFRTFLKAEFSRKDRKVDYVMLRGTEGGLRLMEWAGTNGRRT